MTLAVLLRITTSVETELTKLEVYNLTRNGINSPIVIKVKEHQLKTLPKQPVEGLCSARNYAYHLEQ